MTWTMSVSAVLTMGGLGVGFVAAVLAIVLGFLNIFSGSLDEVVKGLYAISAVALILAAIGGVSMIIGFIISVIRGPKQVPESVKPPEI